MQKKDYTLPEKLVEIAEKFPNKIALQIKKAEGYEKYTYHDLHKKALAIAHSLINLGIKKDDRVAIVLENRPEWALVYFGIMFASAIAVPLDSQSTTNELEYFFKDSESKIVFTSQNLRASVCEAAKSADSLQHIVLLDEKEGSDKILPFANLLVSSYVNPNETRVDHNDIASILYTSGTTGKPKGVMLTHENFYSNFRNVEHLKVFAEDHNVLSILPLHHSFPFMATLLIPLFTHNKISYITNFKKEEITNCMRETGVSILVGVPQLFYLFHQAIENEIKNIPFFFRLPLLGLINVLHKFRDLTNINLNKIVLAKVHKTFGKKLKYFICGGAKLDKETEIFLNKIGFTIIQGYGLTETSPIVTFNPVEKVKTGSAGKTLSDVDIKLFEPNENGIGEVLIRGPNVMKGYYKHEKETNEAIKDGWLYSGDLGYLDEEEYLFLTGRKKELIILGSGKNISPQEVEAYYTKNRSIKELCVLSIGEGEKEKLVAVLVPDFEYFKKTGEIDINDVIKSEIGLLSRSYPPYKRIMGFITTKEELPKTRLHKLKRYEIRKKYLGELTGIKPKEHKEDIAEEDVKIMVSETFKTISSIIKTTKQLETPLYLDDHLGMDLGFDSLGRIELLSIIEKQFDINIPEHLAAEISTLKELITIVNKSINEQKPGPQPTKPLTKENLWENILKTEPTETITKKIDITPRWLAKKTNIIFFGFLRIVFKLMWRIKISGIKNLPKEGSFILCPNHTSYLDAFLVGASLPNRLKESIFFLGFHIYFDVPIVRSFIKIGKIIPLDPATNLIDAIRACGYVLRHNKTLCIFPEGARSPDGKIKAFKKGVGILAQELDIPLVPVYIDGTFKALPIGNAIPKFNQLKITFGKPLSSAQLKEKGLALGATDNHDAITKGIQAEVAKLDKVDV